MDTLDHRQLLRWLTTTAELIAAHEAELTSLDAAIGDADHGANLQRGFRKVMSLMPTLENQDLAGIMKSVGMALIASVGGASGPLYGTWFLRASACIAGRAELTATELGQALQAGVVGVMERGRASPGDKTMVDALLPAAQICLADAAEGVPLGRALDHAAAAAHAGMLSTTGMIARRGRASYLGERSVGHQDPGATSAQLLIRALADAVASP
jgi:dihydroxyacetone kinase-like protein